MTEQQVLDLINLCIVANGNNEITADVLRPILEAMVEQPNDLIGNLSTLNIAEQSNLVSAINEIYNSLSNNTGIQLYEGVDDPNDTPPTTYNIADFYIQKDISNNPIQLWQYNGIEWRKAGDIYAESTAYQETRFDYVGSNSFTIPYKVQAIIVKKNGNPTESKLDWNQLGNVVTYAHAMEADDFLLISGIYVNQSDAPIGSGIETVTDDGNTVVVVDNTNPLNPVITFDGVITDGMTIGGSGTVADPLNVISGSQSFEDVLQVNRTATTSPLIPNATEPTGAVNLQQLQAYQKLHNVLIDNNIGDIVRHTGTTMYTIVKTYTIPAGFFTSDCVFETDLMISKIGTAGNIVINFGIAPLATTLPIHLITAPAGNQYINIGRKMTMVKNGKIVGFGNSGYFYSDKLANGGAMNKASFFNPTISNTFNLSITLGDASDIALLENLTIKVYKNV